MSGIFVKGGRNNRVRQSATDFCDEASDPIEGREIHSPEDAQQQVVTPSLSSRDVEYLANHLSQVVTQALSKQIQAQAHQNSDSGNEIIRYLKGLFNCITEKDEKTGQRCSAIIREIQSLHQTLENQNRVIGEQAAIIKKQHERILQYENDVIYKTQKDLIMELIGIADQLRYTLTDYAAADKDFDSLYKSVGDLTEWVDGSLQAAGVRKSVNADDDFDRKRQEIIEIQDTEFPEKDGKIASILPGYIWAVPMVGSNEVRDEGRPKVYEFMIRPEQVVRLRYVKPVDTSVQQEAPRMAIPEDDNGGIGVHAEETKDMQEAEDVKDIIKSGDEEKESFFWEGWTD